MHGKNEKFVKTSFSKFKARKIMEDLGVKGKVILKLN
jgi:hypothetical protein